MGSIEPTNTADKDARFAGTLQWPLVDRPALFSKIEIVLILSNQNRQSRGYVSQTASSVLPQSNPRFMKLMARLMTVLYLVLVIFVTFNTFGFQTDLLQNPRPLVFVALGIISFIVLNKVIDESSDSSKPDDDDEA
jgi:hypothetical protein